MHLCYLDESGTSDIPGNSSYFVLAGISVPIWHWTACDREINELKRQFGLEESEIHTAWMLRRYPEQEHTEICFGRDRDGSNGAASASENQE